jgi:exodeoxyribonuclease-5
MTEVVDDTPVSTRAPNQIPLALTEQQSDAVDRLIQFIEDPDPASIFFTFGGYAGTGKTFCMREVISRCGGSKAKFAFTAPTNKAATELRRITGDAITIYALLGLRIDKSGELKTLVSGKAPPDLSDYDVIFIDEGSMVNRNLFQILDERCTQYNIKVVFMGDKAQLPPVGEAESPIWKEKQGTNLTRVMRHDNQILSLVTELREVMNSIAPSITIKSDHSETEGVWKLSKAKFKEDIYNAACNGAFADGAKAKILAWRNVKVNEYNQIVRQAIYGAAAFPGSYMMGERIVAAGPCMRGDESLLNTDDEAIVESAIDCQHPLEPKYKAIELKCRTELNKVIRLLVLHPESRAAFDNDSQALAHDAKGNGKLWKKFWDHKDLFHDIKYAYALTVHRAQGSTYQNVWVDYQDILLNRNRREAFQCLYVACSRPTTRLYLA